MRKIFTVLALSASLATGAYLGMQDVCRPVCDIHLRTQKVVLEKVYVDFNNDGYFDKNELRSNYPVSRKEMAVVTFKDFGSRYIWIYPAGAKQPKYQIKGRAVGLGQFSQKYLSKDLLDCCYTQKGASRNKNKKQKPGNNPKVQKTLIRFDLVQSAKVNSLGELEIVTPGLGKFVLQKDKARKEQARIKQYQMCNCSAALDE